jgi:lanosterol synthase
MVLKRFNPAEIYGNCMLEYSYTECTASCVRGLAYALAELRPDLPTDLRAAMEASIERGRRFLVDAQHENGAWAGFWGVNFTYGTYFAVHGLLAAGMSPDHPSIDRAVRWLVEHQRADGGWGESWKGLLDESDVPLPDDEASVGAQTAWALLTLMAATPREHDEDLSRSIRRGITFLIDLQADDGGWPHDRATGVFFNTAVLDYRLYKHEFPTWALARFLGRSSREG